MALLTSVNATEGLDMLGGGQFTFDGQDPAGTNSSTAFSWLSPDGSDVQAFGSGITWSSPSGDPLTGTITALEFDFNNDNFATPDVEITGFTGNLVAMTTGNSLLTEVFGGNDTINGTGFADTLKGSAGADSILGNGGADLIYGDQAIENATNDGNDTISGGGGNDTIFGGGGNDILNGNSGANSINGGSGNDVITEGGADTVNAGAGNDRVILTSTLISSADSWDGGADNDILDLRQIAYAGTSVEIDLLNERIEASNGSATFEEILNFESVYGSDGTELIRGDNNANYLWGGNGGNDTIFGNGGNDSLYGSTGVVTNDSIRGGSGNDFINGFDGDDYLAGDQDNDTIFGGLGNDSLFGNLGNDFLAGGQGNDSINGNSGTNTIEHDAADAAVGFGNDTVNGGFGTDTLRFDGAATYNLSGFQLSGLEGIRFIGTDGFFRATFNADEINDGFTTGVAVAGDSGAGSSHLIEIDMGSDTTIDLSSWTFSNWDSGDEIDIDGDASSEIFTGSSQRDDISGGDGFNTYIVNGAGSEEDSLRGGAGTDRIQVQNTTDMSSTAVQLSSIDEIEFTNFSGGITNMLMLNAQEMDTANELSSTAVIDGAAGGAQDILHITMGPVNSIDLSGWTFQDWGGEDDYVHIVGDGSSENITGTVENDSIEGGSGNDTLLGDAGDDTIIGGGGNDSMDGGAGRDFVDFSGSSVNFNVNMVTGATSIAGEVVLNFEDLTIDVGSNVIVGNNAANTIITGEDNDTVTGGNGADTILSGNDDDDISGEAGNDVLNAGGGLDFLNGGTGADTLQGGNGRDTAVYTDSASAVSINMTTNTYVGGEATGDVLLSIEDIFGSLGNDTITGDSSSNLLLGNVGADVLDGGSGNVRDVLLGGAQNDTMVGNDGNDILNGGGGNDVMIGGNGNDVFVGGNGADSFTGGAGVDIFVFQQGSWGSGVITDWEDGQDRVRIVSAFDETDATLAQVGSDVLFTLVPTGDTILFEDTLVSELNLTSYDFIFI